MIKQAPRAIISSIGKAVLLLFFIGISICAVAGKPVALPHWPAVSRNIDALTVALERSIYYDSDPLKREKLARKLSREARKAPGNRRAAMRARYWEAYLSYESAEYDRTLQLVSKALKEFNDFRDTYDYERLRSLAIALDWKLGKLSNLYPELKHQEKYYSSVHDAVYQAFICRYLSFYLRETENYEESLHYINLADSIYNSNGLTNYRLKNKLNVASTLALNGRRSQSIELLDSLLKSPVALADTTFYLNVCISAISFYNSLPDKMSLSDKAYSLATRHGDPILIAISAFNLGKSFLENGRKDEAERYLQQATRLGLLYNNHRLLSESLEALTSIKKDKQQWDSAFHYQSMLMTALDSLATTASRYEIIKTDAQLQKETYENQLKATSERLELQKKVNMTMLLSGTLLILALSFGIFNFIKKNKLLKDLEQTRQKVIDTQNRQIADYALNLNQKVDMINRISGKIDRLQKSDSLTVKGADSLRQDIQGNINAEESWVYLKLNFKKEHPGYISRLQDRCPGLTQGEIRICVYIRMGFSTKQISTMLSVLPDSIKTFRHRIRRKLSLDKGGSLEDFLSSLDT